MNTNKVLFLVTATLLIFILACSGCGMQGQLDNLRNDLQQQQDEIDRVKGQIIQLTNTIASNISSMDALETSIDQLQNAYNVLMANYQAGDASLQGAVDDVNDQLETMLVDQAVLQMQVNNQMASLATLEMRETIASFVDPCGPSGGFDEVLMRTSTDTLIAYFESGGNRHLTILSPGSYQTTDSQHCYFTVNSGGQVCENGNALLCH